MLNKNTVQDFKRIMSLIGQDLHAYKLWKRYLSFLKSAHRTTGNVQSIRSAYQRAVVTPMHKVALIWNDYLKWERSHSKHLADALFEKWYGKFCDAVEVCKHRARLRRGILMHILARYPLLPAMCI